MFRKNSTEDILVEQVKHCRAELDAPVSIFHAIALSRRALPRSSPIKTSLVTIRHQGSGRKWEVERFI